MFNLLNTPITTVLLYLLSCLHNFYSVVTYCDFNAFICAYILTRNGRNRFLLKQVHENRTFDNCIAQLSIIWCFWIHFLIFFLIIELVVKIAQQIAVIIFNPMLLRPHFPESLAHFTAWSLSRLQVYNVYPEENRSALKESER